VKRNSGGLWFSAKRKEKTRSVIVRDLGSTMHKKGEVRERLSDSSLRDDWVSMEVLGMMDRGQNER